MRRWWSGAVGAAALVALGAGCPTDDVGPEVPCEAPAAIRTAPSAERSMTGEPAFVDVTDESGIGWLPTVQEWQELVDEAPEGTEDYNQWGGFAVGDFDGNGYLDVLFTNKYDPPRLFLGTGRMRFVEIDAEDAGLSEPGAGLSGASTADVDGDGDLDVLLVGRSTALLENRTGEGGPLFEQVRTIAPPVEAPASIELSASWADIDRDGDLDVHIANWGWDPAHPVPSYDRILVQNRDGAFDDRSEDFYPRDLDGSGYVGGWTDLDRDDDLDLVIIQEADNRGDGANVFLRHDGEFGADLSFSPHPVGLEVPGRAMGLGLGDFDADLDLDVHVTDIGPTKLFEQRDGMFIDVATAALGELAPPIPEGSWSTFFVDVDNDGTLELFTALGVLGDDALEDESLRPQRDRLWRRNGANGLWEDIGEASGLTDIGSTRGALAVDMNEDGCVDLLTFRLLRGPLLLQGVCPADAAWLTVELHQGDGNPNAIGARVEAHDGAEYVAQREVYAGSIGVYTGGPPEVRFGLGDRDLIDLRVRWPDGTRTCNRVPTRMRINLTK